MFAARSALFLIFLESGTFQRRHPFSEKKRYCTTPYSLLPSVMKSGKYFINHAIQSTFSHTAIWIMKRLAARHVNARVSHKNSKFESEAFKGSENDEKTHEILINLSSVYFTQRVSLTENG